MPESRPTQPGDPRVSSDVAAEQAAAASQPGDGLDGLTKDQLLGEAEARGVEVRTSATKTEILAALRSAPPAAPAGAESAPAETAED